MPACCQCRRLFEPSPRVGARQVTCGDAACRRRNHAASCRRWRERNRDSVSQHYPDVVVGFRERRPTYQREWRILRGLREIRDAIEPVLRACALTLARLLASGDTVLAARVREPARPPGHDRFAEVMAVGRRLSALVTELAALVRQLDAAARCSARRDTRRD